jgi:hypothetical protein
MDSALSKNYNVRIEISNGVVFDFTRFEFDGTITREDSSGPFTAVSIVPCHAIFLSILGGRTIHSHTYTLSFCVFAPQALMVNWMPRRLSLM